jgi:hypothetical protein
LRRRKARNFLGVKAVLAGDVGGGAGRGRAWLGSGLGLGGLVELDDGRGGVVLGDGDESRVLELDSSAGQSAPSGAEATALHLLSEIVVNAKLPEARHVRAEEVGVVGELAGLGGHGPNPTTA